MQLWWKIFQISVNGDVVHTQTLEVLTLKNLIEPFLRLVRMVEVGENGKRHVKISKV